MNKKKIFLFIFWIFSIVFFECIYRMTLFNNIFEYKIEKNPKK